MVARGKPAGPFRTQPISGNTVTGGRPGPIRQNRDLMREEEHGQINKINKLRQAETAHQNTGLVWKGVGGPGAFQTLCLSSSPA